MNRQEPLEMGQDARAEGALESWKEIAGYLGRQVKTAQRWEKEEGLPIHRHSHKSRSSVYAFPSEIDAWRASRKAIPETLPTPPLWKTLLAPPRSLAFGVTVLLCLIMVGNGVHPQTAFAQQGPTARQVWRTTSQIPGTPSVDGRYIAYTSNGDLGVRDLTTGTVRLLTHSGGWGADGNGDYAESPVISPDGRMIAYGWWSFAKGSDGENELRLIAMAGGTPRTLWRGADADYVLPCGWTPDGRQILVMRTLADQTSQIVLVSAADDSVHIIKSLGWQQSSAQLSPDGRLIAYDRPADGKSGARDIFLLAADGSFERPLVEHPANDANPFWTPDGGRVLFNSNRTGTPSLWAVSVSDGKPAGPVLVQSDMVGKRPLGITRGGVLYYWSRGNEGTNIYVADLDGTLTASHAPRLATERFVNHNMSPSLSPNGQFLAYYSGRPGQGMALVLRELKTGRERDVPVEEPLSNADNIGPQWFPDGRSLLVRRADAQQRTTVLRLRLADGVTETLFRAPQRLFGYALAPDGNSFFYVNGVEIVRFDIGTKVETVLHRERTDHIYALAVAPDGRSIAYAVSYMRSKENGERVWGMRLEVIAAAGGEGRVVYQDEPWPGDPIFGSFSWTADGRSLLFARNGATENEHYVLWRVSASGGVPKRVLSSKGTIRSPQTSLDGRQLYFSGRVGSPGELWTVENFLADTALAAK